MTTQTKQPSKAKQFDNLVKAYILSNIDVSCYVGYLGIEREPESDKEKLQTIYNIFMSEYGWRVKQTGLVAAVADYLAGLPSSIDIAFMNCDIVKLGELWGKLKPNATESKQFDFIENWFNLIANKLCQLWREAGII